jgi:hypothetical protein
VLPTDRVEGVYNYAVASMNPSKVYVGSARIRPGVPFMHSATTAVPRNAAYTPTDINVRCSRLFLGNADAFGIVCQKCGRTRSVVKSNRLPSETKRLRAMPARAGGFAIVGIQSKANTTVKLPPKGVFLMQKTGGKIL